MILTLVCLIEFKSYIRLKKQEQAKCLHFIAVMPPVWCLRAKICYCIFKYFYWIVFGALFIIKVFTSKFVYC